MCLKGVIATETLRNGQGIAEFMGIVSTENEYVNSSNFDPLVYYCFVSLCPIFVTCLINWLYSCFFLINYGAM